MDLLKMFELATANKLFDAHWYMNRYRLHFDTEIDAFIDYLRKSSHSWVDPSETFSTQRYFKSNISELMGKPLSPLEHYIKQNKTFDASYAQKHHWTPTENLVSTAELKAHANYAITGHIFYADYIPKLVGCLSHAKFSFDLLLAVTSQEVLEKAYESFKRVQQVQSIYIRIAPNRGRNFGPLLVEYGRHLLNYEYFCHVHSKKSLFSGSNQEIWGDYLYEYLLRDKQILHQALAIFEQNSNLGIYFPTAFTRSLPKWASHTLKNKQSIQELGRLLNIPCPQNGFISYPVGGMFWARSNSLRALLEYPWKYEHFPEEPIPHDGTILHAIERMLVPICRHHDYDHFVYHPASGKFTTSESHLYEEYFTAKQDIGYITHASPCKIVSFDVFDTLFFRQLPYPDQAKENVAKLLNLSDAQEFVQLRNDSEFNLRKAKNFEGDVSILEVYDRLSSLLQLNKSVQELADLEFEEDLKLLLPKSEIAEALMQCLSNNRHVYIITDTYYLQSQIRKLLDCFGFPQGLTLFVSSEFQRRKDNGTMWEYIKQILSEQGIHPLHEFMHIGDNVVSDCQIPGDYGIGTYHVLNPFEKWSYMSTSKLQESDMKNPRSRYHYGPLIAQLGSSPFI